MTQHASAPAGLTVLERGWLSSNNVLLHPDPRDTAAAVLIDSGHGRHAEQTLALLEQALDGQTLARVINTHLHSDHCGGNAAVQQHHVVTVATPPGLAQAVHDWDTRRLTYAPTGQHCPRFSAQDELVAGASMRLAGSQTWDVIAAPGHDPDAVMLLRASDGVLISADALWENGFGVVFPELEGQDAFDAVAEVLDLIERLDARLVIPGHGACFHDVAGALARARRRLAAHRGDPARHARHGAKVLLKYHLMEVGRQRHADLQAWAAATPLLESCRRRSHSRLGPAGFTDELLQELLDAGALRRADDWLLDA